MNRNPALIILSLIATSTACEVPSFDHMPWTHDNSFVRIYLVNDSTTHYVSPNPGLCPEGLDVQPHFFLDDLPVLAPGESANYTTVRLAGPDGRCIDRTDFMIGLCGWGYGTDSAALSHCSDRYGGQIGFQFSCGDTVILRWTDAGANVGTWTSEVLPAQGNSLPSLPFQNMPPPEGGSCGQ